MDSFLFLVPLFFMVEAMVEFFKIMFNAFSYEVAGSFVLGVLVSIFFGIDILALLNMPTAINIPWLVIVVNAVFLGILVSRYSGRVNDLLEILKGFVSVAKARL